MMEKIIVEMGDFIRDHPSLHKKKHCGHELLRNCPTDSHECKKCFSSAIWCMAAHEIL